MRHDSHYVEELTQSHNFIGRTIPIIKIEPNPLQPRVEMGDLSELVASIQEKGVLEPLLVKPLPTPDKWLIIAGERRWRAAGLAGLTEVPCIELNISDQEVAEIALIENLQRKDLTVWEEAEAYEDLCQRFKYTHEDLAKKLSKSRSSITETLTIASLPASIKQKCVESGISSKSAILKVARKFDINEMLEEIKNSRKQENQAQSDSNKPYKPSQKQISKADNVSAGENLNVGFPLRLFKFNEKNNNYKLEIKFKKPASINELKSALAETLNVIENGHNISEDNKE
jgi:ParB family chromosome partitioning protein